MITYCKGDATRPVDDEGIIVHVCNNAGGWGAGFVLAVSRRWPEPERKYRAWAKSGYEEGSGKFELGQVQLVSVGPKLWVANMVAQDGFGEDGRIPLRYDALKKCLDIVDALGGGTKLSVHMPRIGCGLAGGTWAEVGPIVEKSIASVNVYVYDL